MRVSGRTICSMDGARRPGLTGPSTRESTDLARNTGAESTRGMTEAGTKASGARTR